MQSLLQIIFVTILLANMALVVSSRLGSLIKIAALEGILLGVATCILRDWWLTSTLLLAAATMVVKGGVFPLMLSWATREIDIKKEVEPYVGYAGSMIVAIGMLTVSYWISRKLPVFGDNGRFVTAVALFTILTGLFLIVSRKKAVTQIIGYLVLENGITALGLSFPSEIPFAIELGLLLDIFVGVFIMGIVLYHINREFHHVDMDELSELKDWEKYD